MRRDTVRPRVERTSSSSRVISLSKLNQSFAIPPLVVILRSFSFYSSAKQRTHAFSARITKINGSTFILDKERTFDDSVSCLEDNELARSYTADYAFTRLRWLSIIQLILPSGIYRFVSRQSRHLLPFWSPRRVRFSTTLSSHAVPPTILSGSCFARLDAA